MESGIPPRYQPLILPIVVSLAVVVIGIIAGRNMVGRVLSLRSDISEAQSSVEILEGRLAILRGLSGRVDVYESNVLSAIPVSNSTLVATAQIKSIANNNGLLLTDIRSIASASEDKELSSLNIRFSLVGSYEQVQSFVEEISNVTPLMNLSDLNISLRGGEATADVSLSTFWGPLPTELPPINKPIQDLNADELELLTRLSGFSRPVIEGLPGAQTPSVRADPFEI
jgi:Tfp pilus assembly protein PilO